MQTKLALAYDDAAEVMKAARAEALANGWSVGIAVVDDGGHLVAFERMDGCAPIGAYIALEKARSAALGRRDTKVYEDMVNGGRFAFVGAPQITPLEGGVLIKVGEEVVGAVGVSGVKPDQDTRVAKAGSNALHASKSYQVAG
ncbi:heme-binding protein [Pseudomonas sp. PS1]|uniref:Heme-binding protein n=1 Tax=Stutzerimonas marianensis TaxID=2929513 RepID=A0A9X2AS29_9GAMM|nr:heme-binding protein [Pseudomonas marianensis]MCJ0973220.1 heme-binding protein [Pseudomonas marianensis]